MKIQRILPLAISCFTLWFSVSVNAQNDSIPAQQQPDSVKVKHKYGLRLGGDLSKLARSFFDDDYTGFEITGDYRITKNLYVAGELGTEEKITTTDFLSVTASGSYFKAGVDYNFYDNWLDMDNMIYGGFRIGASTFSQTLNEYTVYATDQYWHPQFNSEEAIEHNGLSALWAEFRVGMKVEVLNNLYLGAYVSLNGMISQDQPNNLENLYVPGYNKTYDSGRIGAGFGYTLAYRIPLYKQ